MLYLGVDGGGTKTAYIVTDAGGGIRSTYVGPSCAYLGAGIGTVEPVLRAGVETVLAMAGATADQLAYAFFGLPSYGEVRDDLAVLDAIPGRILGHGRYACGNDMLTGWAGSLGARDGVNVIAGTGSMAYGEREGVGRRAGGWGEVLGDEGSAFWIGRHALNAATRMSDGRMPRAGLYAALRESLGMADDLELVTLFPAGGAEHRRRVAALACVVDECAERGDEVALGILRDAAVELAALADAVADAVGFARDELVPVSYSGGVFASRLVRDEFGAVLGSRGRRYDVRPPLDSPVVGAALLAARAHARAQDGAAR